MGRKLGLDIGDVRIGLAVSDLLCLIANPRETYVRRGDSLDFEYFKALIKNEGIDEIVIGLPVNMDGTNGRRTELVKEYGQALSVAVPNVGISYMDERLTTVQAEKALIASDMRRENRKKVVDKVAACLILQAYLDKLNRKNSL